MAIELDSIESNVRILNAIEFAMLDYARKSKWIQNPYQYFSELLGYKSKNYVYRWFKERDATKIGLNDIRRILEITRNTELAELIGEELKKGL